MIWFLFKLICILFSSLGLALASLLTIQDDIIYQRFDTIVQCVCETLNDIMKEDLEDDTNKLIEWVQHINIVSVL